MTVAGRLGALLLEESDIRGHLERLRDLVVSLDAQQVVELGVRTGRSTTALLAGVEVTGGRLWSCDLHAPGVPAEVAEHPQWTLVLGDDLVLADEAPRPIDLLFIDTSHELVHTADELATYGPLVRPGGVVALHDTDPELWPECAQASREWFESLPAARLEFHAGHNGLTVIRV